MLLSDIDERKKRLIAWWDHEDMEKPCLMIRIRGKSNPAFETEDLTRYWTDEEFVTEREIDAIDRSLWLGDSVPYHFMFLGSFMVGAFLGGDMRFLDKETSWHEAFVHSIDEVAGLQVNAENKWWRLLKNLTFRSSQKAKNRYYVSYSALSGITDIISNVYGVEPLLLDFMEDPEGVERAAANITGQWLGLFRESSEIIKTSGNDGYIGWSGVWAPGTTFPIQEDISYMISTDQFKRFCMPGIERLVEELEYPYYHLDGKGAIRFLDELAGIRKLKAIQWVPGAGNEEMSQWHGLVRRILDKGKSVHVSARDYEVVPLVEAVGGKGLLVTVECESPDSAYRLLERFGCDY